MIWKYSYKMSPVYLIFRKNIEILKKILYKLFQNIGQWDKIMDFRFISEIHRSLFRKDQKMDHSFMEVKSFHFDLITIGIEK